MKAHVQLARLMGLAGAIVVLRRAGRGTLALPQRWSRVAIANWAVERSPTVLVFAGLRIVVLGLAYYLAVIVAATLVARALRLAWLQRLTQALTVPSLRGLTGAIAGGAFATTALATPLVSPPALGTVAPLGSRPVHHRSADAEPPLLWQLPDPIGPPAASRVAAAVGPPAPPRAPPAASTTVWVVARGDNLWGIAEDALGRAWRRAPTIAATAMYWRSVVASSGLADPNLVFPGQRIALPAPPDPPSNAAC
jgi:nucleoid-associated protein YgaU